MTKHKRCTRALAAAGLLLTGPLVAQAPADSIMRAHFVDVGQGDAALLEFSCGVVLIDAGGQDDSDANALVGYLNGVFARRTDLDRTIETIFITHNHVDHTRSLLQVLDTFTVHSVVEHGLRGRPGDVGDTALVRMEERLAAGELSLEHVDVDDAAVTHSFGLVTAEIDPVGCAGTDPILRVLSADFAENIAEWPAADFEDKNNHSVVVRVDFGQASFLFTGDLERPTIETMVDFYQGTPLLDADVYQVGHHGSANGTTWSLLNAIEDTEIAVISMGPCDSNAGIFNAFQHGHPRREIVRMLQAAVSRRRNTPKRVSVADGQRRFGQITMRDAVFATGWDGNVVVQATRGGRYRVTIEDQGDGPSC